MIKELIAYLVSLQTPKNPVSVEIHGQPFEVKADGTVGVAIKPVIFDMSFEKPALPLTTLSGLVAAYNAKVGSLGDRVALYISSFMKVELIDLDQTEFGKRRVYAIAQHLTETAFPFDTFLDPEPFLLKFRASFYFNDEAVMVQQLCSTICAGSGVAIADDGISQEVTVKTGTITKGGATLPADGVKLIPWRTFRDVSPVESRFLLRMRGVKDGLPQIALFEIDAKWRLDTVNSIRSYLQAELPAATIIA